MADSLATVANKSPAFPRNHPSSLPTQPGRGLKIVPGPNIASPTEEPAFDLQRLLNKFMPGKSRREYTAGESVFSQGDSANAVFYILSGKIKLTVVSTNGKEAVIAHLPVGSFFGEGSLAGELHRSSSAETLQPSVIFRIESNAMQDLLHREQEFAQHFRAHLLSRNIRLQADLVDHLFNSSEKRLARILMLMANFGQDSKPVPVIAKISQETLAEMIGTTRSRVSYFLNRFRSLGYIDYNTSGMIINSTLVNIVLHD